MGQTVTESSDETDGYLPRIGSCFLEPVFERSSTFPTLEGKLSLYDII